MTDSKTATERLREKLTERKVDYEVKDLPNIKFFHDTRWNANGVRWCYTEFVGARTYLTMCNEWKDCTPEQAIAATLGGGECKAKWVLHGKTQTQEFWRCECGNCGEWFGVEERSSFPFKMTIDEVEIPNYCPNCGRKVVNNDNQ